MSHFAEISGSGSGSITYTVTRVLVAEQDFINSGAVGASSNWVQTSYNTKGGVHYEPNSNTPSPVIYQDASGSSYTTLEEANASGSGTITPVSQSITLALRKNYAGTGYTYDRSKDAFISPQPPNFVSSSLMFSEDDDPLSSYIRNYFTQNPSGSIPHILNEDSCLWELSGSGV